MWISVNVCMSPLGVSPESFLGSRVQCKWIMERGTELTTVVLDGDVFGQQLLLASHTNEQRASSPAGAEEKMETGRESES